MLRYIRHISYLLVFAACTMGCSREALQLYQSLSDGDIRPGDAVMFTSYLPGDQLTKTAQSVFQDEIRNSYKAVNREYSFTVSMFESSDPENMLGSSTYAPSMNGVDEFVGDGTLELASGAQALLWPDNVKKYGFKVSSGSATLSAIQSTESLFVAQDRLEGVSYSPVWVGDPDTGYNPDKVDFVNFRSSKEWYASNKSVFEQYGQMATSNEEYKKVPLFLQHKRSMITVVLKADEGVGRDQLDYDIARTTIEARINSYVGETEKKISPFAESATIDYTNDDYGGAATGVGTIKYSAVVEPFNYLDVAEEKPICTINLSGQKFTYYASNDADYNQYLAEKSNPQSDAAKRVANAYDLKAGQHLTLVVTLSRESRKIVITAYVEDWKDKITNTICDDYGLNGDPEKIRNRAELLAFLQSSKNKSGAVAIITPTALDLEFDTELDNEGNIISSTQNPWPTSGLKLNCMLNLAGSVIYTEHRFLDEISSSGNLVNGTIVVRHEKTLDAVVADTNKGTVENVSVMSERGSDNLPLIPMAKVTRAGIVNLNNGTIFSCSSSIPVEGTGGFIGGIAAQSLKEAGSSKSPYITDCVMTAKVTGDNDVTAAGGIVGNAEGVVRGNTFEYGITVLQDEQRFKNIVGQKQSGATLTAERNSWPTTVMNSDAGTNVSDARFTGVIMSQAELAKVLRTNTYNSSTSKILIIDDFTVSNDWEYGKQDATLDIITNGNVLFELEGNDKTITLAGGDRKVNVDGTEYATCSMLFTNIQNNIQNLTIVLDESLIAKPSSSKDENDNSVFDGLDAIAPLGYSVHGATLSNIKIKTNSEKYIQAAMPAGIVAWAYGNAKFDRCIFKGDVNVWLPSSIGDSDLRFAGGIVALAEEARFTQCYYSSGSITAPTGKSVYCGGILGGISRRSNDSGSTPLVSLKDCASRYDVQTSSPYKGVVIGASYYLTGSTSGDQRADGLDHTDAGKCEGNWWNSSQRAIGTTYNGMSDVKALGPRNSVEPVIEDF